MQESKQEDTQVAYHVKMAENLPTVSSPFPSLGANFMPYNVTRPLFKRNRCSRKLINSHKTCVPCKK